MSTVSAQGLREKLILKAEQIAQDTVDEIVNDLRDAAPVGENGGETRDSITSYQVSSSPHFSFVISSPTPQSVWTEEGTDPHHIQGNPLLVFDWPVTGKLMFLHSVEHPGTPARPWFRPVVGTWVDRLRRAFA